MYVAAEQVLQESFAVIALGRTSLGDPMPRLVGEFESLEEARRWMRPGWWVERWLNMPHHSKNFSPKAIARIAGEPAERVVDGVIPVEYLACLAADRAVRGPAARKA